MIFMAQSHRHVIGASDINSGNNVDIGLLLIQNQMRGKRIKGMTRQKQEGRFKLGSRSNCRIPICFCTLASSLLKVYLHTRVVFLCTTVPLFAPDLRAYANA